VTNKAAEDHYLGSVIHETRLYLVALAASFAIAILATPAGVLEPSCCSLFKLRFSELQVRRSLRHIFSTTSWQRQAHCSGDSRLGSGWSHVATPTELWGPEPRALPDGSGGRYRGRCICTPAPGDTNTHRRPVLTFPCGPGAPWVPKSGVRRSRQRPAPMPTSPLVASCRRH
jgi:hypothetical protein